MPQAEPLKSDLERIVDRTAPLWDELRGQCLFLTGGTGFFGNWLLESFVKANETLDLRASALVLCRDRNSIMGLAPHLREHYAIRFCQGDIRNFEFPQGEFSHIIHAATTSATSTYFSRESALEKFDTVVGGTRRVLEFARHCQAKRFLLTSSGAVYGRQPPNMPVIPEVFSGAPDTTDPASVVPEGKRAAELLCSLYAERYGIETKIARCFSFVGPYLPLDLHYAIGNFIRNALRGEDVLVRGDGSPIRSYLYAADLVVWLMTILVRGEVGRPYNTGSDQEISIADLSFLVRDLLAPHQSVRIMNPETAGNGLQERSIYVPNISRAKSELGLDITVSLSEAIVRTAEAYNYKFN